MRLKKLGFVWVLHPTDNVGTLVGSDAKHDGRWYLRGSIRGSIVIRSAVPHGHKIALRNIDRGDAVIKYGAPIGQATRPVRMGEHVHVHNMESLRGRGDLSLPRDTRSGRSRPRPGGHKALPKPE